MFPKQKLGSCQDKSEVQRKRPNYIPFIVHGRMGTPSCVNKRAEHREFMVDSGGNSFFFGTQRIETESQPPVKTAPYNSNKSARTKGMQRRKESHQRVGATETAIVRDHHRLHARAAEQKRSGGASRAHCGQAFHKLESFLTPSSSRFESDNDQTTPVARSSVPCPPALWWTRLRRPWPPLTVPSAARALQTVMSPKNNGSPEARTYGPVVVGRHCKTHVAEHRIATYCCSHFSGKPGPRSSLAPAPAS